MPTFVVPTKLYVELPEGSSQYDAEEVVAKALKTDDRIYLAQAERAKILVGE